MVIHLGSNGPFTSQQFTAVLNALGEDRAVVFVNVIVPRRWEDEVNRDLAARIAGLPGVSLADWYGTSANQATYFEADGVHLTRAGQNAYAALITQHIKAAAASLAPATGD